MSTHIGAKPGEIADTVLMPGDPLRAKFIAETYLDNPVQYSHVRNMFGYTGTYKGKRLSVQGSGMGIPSLAIYTTELIKEYGVKTIYRVGSCGGMSQMLRFATSSWARLARLIHRLFKIRLALAYTIHQSLTLGCWIPHTIRLRK